MMRSGVPAGPRGRRCAIRILLALAAAGAIGGYAPVAPAQGDGKVLRIGILSSGTYENRGSLDEALVQGLRDQGYVEGKNLVIERRYDSSRVRQNASELADMHLDAIVTTCSPSTRTMKEATSTTPIVMAAVSDPVRQGIIESFANPGRNVTGTSSQAEDILAKRVEHVAAIVPRATIVAVLANGNNPVHALGWQRLESAVQGTQLRLVKVQLASGADLEPALEAAVHAGATALFVLPDDPMMMNLRPRIVSFAVGHRMPDFYWAIEFVESGGLPSYGESLRGSYRSVAVYVDKIKKGANPGSLPVEQPTRFELVINAKRAQALGIAVPRPMLMGADVVVR